MSLSRSVNTSVHITLYKAVMAFLEADPTMVPLYTALNDTEMTKMFSLTAQLSKRHRPLEALKNEHCSKRCPPAANVAATAAERLYGLQRQLPSLDSTEVNTFALSTLRGRRNKDLTRSMALTALFPELDEPHSSYSRTEVNCYRRVTVQNLTEQNAATTGGLGWSNVRSQPARASQSDWCLTMALPVSQLHELLQSTVDAALFNHQQQNYWFNARSALLRAQQMTWQNCPLNLDKNLAILIVNPLREAFTNGIAKRAPGTDPLYNFFRLCLSTIYYQLW